jgi:hypothetical protein
MRQERAQFGVRRKLWAALCCGLASVPGAWGQAAGSAAVMLSSGSSALELERPLPAGQVVREIDDPHLGSRWLLYRDPTHPGGPGRLVQAGQVYARPVQAGKAAPGEGPAAGSAPLTGKLDRPVIHAGDRVILEEDTPVVEARLEAVALNPALAGSPLRVRLRIGGKVVAATALATGRVELAPQAEVVP